jgi:uncharacterized membrane protein (DUF373 family)
VPIHTPFDHKTNKVVLKVLHVFERIVVILLLLMMMAVVGTAVYEMMEMTVTSLGPNYPADQELLTLNELHNIFGFFLLILIGIELIETIKVYLLDDSIRVEIVFLVAMIGIARHVIDLEYKTMEPLALIGIAAVILALTIGYYYLKKSGQYPWRVQMMSAKDPYAPKVKAEAEREINEKEETRDDGSPP